MKHFFLLIAARVALLIFILLPLSAGTASAQSFTWQTAISLTSPVSSGQAYAMTTDAVGNVYVVGAFYGGINFGNIALSSSSASYEMFIAKWDKTTNSVVWAQQFGGAGDDQAQAVALGPGGIYVLGTYTAGIAFGGSTLAGQGTFLARFTDTGAGVSVGWAQGFALGTARKIQVAGSKVYVAGTFNETLTFAGQTQVSHGMKDGFVARLTDTGTAVTADWFSVVGGTQDDDANGLAVNGTSVYVTGNFQGPAVFGSTTVSNAGYNGYVTKLEDAGSTPTYVWTQVGGSRGWDLSVSGASVYVSGGFYRTATFGSLTLTSTNRMGTDGFLAKITDAGSSAAFTWVQPTSMGFADDASVLVRNGSALYVAGISGAEDMFIARFTDAGTRGNAEWKQSLISPGTDRISSMAVTGTGKLYVSGGFQREITFGSILLDPSISYNAYAGFLAIMQDNIVTATTPAATVPALNLYPNPARTSVQVPAATAATTLTLLDVTGRTVRTAPGATLSVLGVAPGLYLLRAATPDQPLRTARLVVE